MFRLEFCAPDPQVVPRQLDVPRFVCLSYRILLDVSLEMSLKGLEKHSLVSHSGR